jgi:hypothetical protein
LKALVDVALFTGMRKSELVPDKTNGDSSTGLTRKQIDYQGGKISLRDTKTGIPRDILLPQSS